MQFPPPFMAGYGGSSNGSPKWGLIRHKGDLWVAIGESECLPCSGRGRCRGYESSSEWAHCIGHNVWREAKEAARLFGRVDGGIPGTTRPARRSRCRVCSAKGIMPERGRVMQPAWVQQAGVFHLGVMPALSKQGGALRGGMQREG